MGVLSVRRCGLYSIGQASDPCVFVGWSGHDERLGYLVSHSRWLLLFIGCKKEEGVAQHNAWACHPMTRREVCDSRP